MYKLGSIATYRVWSKSITVIYSILATGIPILLILCLKMCNLLKDLTTTQVTQSIIFDQVSFHLWPKGRGGKRISLAMTIFIFFLLATRSPFLIARPLPTTRWTSTEPNKTWTRSGPQRQVIVFRLRPSLSLAGRIRLLCLGHLPAPLRRQVGGKNCFKVSEALYTREQSQRRATCS